MNLFKVRIDLNRKWFIAARIRLYQTLASTGDQLEVIPERPSDTRKIEFMTKFTQKLDRWMIQQNMEKIDYWQELTKLPKEHSAEWFSETWNMWLKPYLGLVCSMERV